MNYERDVVQMTEEAFNGLSQEAQIENIKLLGLEALREFGVEPSEVRSLAHFENTTYYVNSPQGEFNLRVSRPGTQNLATLESEIHFLTALRQSGFRVPKPYHDRIVTVEHPEVPEPRHVALLGWMHGEFLRQRLTPVEARLIGMFMAGMHEFVRTWTPPSNFERHHLHNWAFKERPQYSIDKPIAGLAEEDREFLLELTAEARKLLSELPQTEEIYGLIHCDIHVGNVLVEDGQLNVIDFDDTGYAFLYNDFASALAFHLSEPNYFDLQDAMLSGYQEVRPLPPNTAELLEPFLRIRLAGVSRWILDRVDNPKLREDGPHWVHQFCEGLRRLRSVNN